MEKLQSLLLDNLLNLLIIEEQLETDKKIVHDLHTHIRSNVNLIVSMHCIRKDGLEDVTIKDRI